MQHAEFLCGLAVIAAGGLCYLSGWTSRASWSAGAVIVTAIQLILSRSIGCAIAIVVVSVLCACAGQFDRKR